MRAVSVLGCGLALAVGAAAQATVKDGVEAWQAGDYAKAIAEWRGPAEAGDPDAQFDLAQAYKLGRGVPVDMAQARDLYEKAANQGHEQAQANLGLILFQNGDRQAAMPWIRKAADRGEPRAQYVLGTAMFNGDFAPKDWPRAYALMTRAAAAGLPQAKTSLSEMDRFVPLGQRQQGLAIARTLTAGSGAVPAPAPAPKLAAAPPPRLAQAAPPPIRSAPLPPSTYAAPPPPPVPPRAAPPRPPQPRVETAIAPAAPAPKPRVAPAPPVRVAAAPAAKVPAPASGGRWRVQLGAFGTPAAARAAWAGFGGVAGVGGLQPVFESAGAITRLKAGPLADKAAADRACAAARSAGKSCFPVAP